MKQNLRMANRESIKEIYGKYPSKVGLWYLIHDKFVQVEIEVNKIEKIKEKIKEYAEGIESNKFSAKPTFFNCTYCDFSNICSFSCKK